MRSGATRALSKRPRYLVKLPESVRLFASQSSKLKIVLEAGSLALTNKTVHIFTYVENHLSEEYLEAIFYCTSERTDTSEVWISLEEGLIDKNVVNI